MKEMQFDTLWAVTQIMLGSFFWPLLFIVVVVLGSFFYLLIKEKGVVSCRLKGSSFLGLFGGVIALFFLFSISESSISNLGGPIDLILVILAYIGGFLGSAILLYTIAGFLKVGRCSCK
ncbi:DUF5368 domain-containing protein [Pasteurella canis]|uniref:DUF5368 domain-containing protein n=1 Tax=Pasteurella canis TaxID=753 RepID=UPI00132CA9DE|nr:DUF5368 domain-containing protein [Pasteurella canis]MXN88837.1 hypothetical protein [Pasteurella canis]UDW83430.1 DUF5368 domain-containing protein [Pasteurella canis]